MIEHVVMFSGGAGSWAAAKRVVDRFGADGVVLLCADTRSEHADWRPFVDAAAENVGAPLVMLDEGLDVWQLAEREKMIPNSGADFCSRILKREPMKRWWDEHAPGAVSHYGFDWTEEHRLVRLRARLAPRKVDAPLCWDPPLSKDQVLDMLDASGLPMPTAYQLGMPHNNCLAIGCVKAGQAYWERLLREMPEVYARAEASEERMREQVGDHSILKDRTFGRTRPLPLRVFRERQEMKVGLFDAADWGNCSCMDPGDAE